MTKPILVCMSWRGGRRLQRCLDSIATSARYFSRTVISVSAEVTSADLQRARAFAKQHPGVEVLCHGEELPTMQHQAMWVTYLIETGANRSDWVLWLAHDDELRTDGIGRLVDDDGPEA